MSDSATPCTAALQALLSFTISQSLLILVSAELVMLTISSSVIPFSFCLQSFPASVFSSKSALHIGWPKYWSFSFIISPSSKYSGLISFRIDWFDLSVYMSTLIKLLKRGLNEVKILKNILNCTQTC